jgi:hypothetical protein
MGGEETAVAIGVDATIAKWDERTWAKRLGLGKSDPNTRPPALLADEGARARAPQADEGATAPAPQAYEDAAVTAPQADEGKTTPAPQADEGATKLIDPKYFLTEAEAGIMFYARHYDFDHKDRRRKRKHLIRLKTQEERLKEIGVTQILCTVCHRSKTWIEEDSNNKRAKISRGEISNEARDRSNEKYERWLKYGGCEGAEWRPGYERTCPHEQMLTELFNKIKDNFAMAERKKKNPTLDPQGKLTASQLFMRIAYDWDHRDPDDKTAGINTIVDPYQREQEIKKCDLLCVFCHRMKTYLNRDVVTVCFSKEALKPYTTGKVTVDDDHFVDVVVAEDDECEIA